MASYAPPTTMSDLRGYVTGPGSGFAARAESTVLLHVSHSHLRARFPEIRLDLHVELLVRRAWV
jgi:tubulin-folding cofactor B